MNRNGSSRKKQHRLKKILEGNDNNDSDHGNRLPKCSTLLTPVDIMTSRDFHLDQNAHVENMNQVLRDTVRIESFKAAILHNKHLFKGKIVLNIGCGTGIYALFAAKAGACKVFAVDSSNAVCYAKQIVQSNGYSEIIEVIKGRIEEIQLPVKEVDIIVCDWMGYALFYQSICDIVIYARDKWLKKPGGLIFPDQFKLYMVALEDAKHKNDTINWWSNVYGFNMSCIREVSLSEPRCHSINPDQVISKQFPIKFLNLNTATLDDLKFRSKFMLPIQKSGLMDGIALYFHVYFSKSHTPLGFSTDPWSPRTNWLQTVLFFDQALSVSAGSLYYGGIEFVSPGNSINLNDIVINLEMLMGDPKHADIEIDMSWQFKLKESIVPPQNKMSNETINKTNLLKAIQPGSEQKIGKETVKVSKSHSISNQNNLITQNTIRCSGSVVTINNFNDTITIGRYDYPCRKNKRNKNKYPKKV